MSEGTFKYFSIYEITHYEDLCNFLVIHPHCSIRKDFDTVKSFPAPVLRLEKFYDLQDKFKVMPNCKTNYSCLKYETINLGTDSHH